MKKIYFLTCLTLLTLSANAQVIFNVVSPSPISGMYDLTYAPDSLDGNGGWNGGDLNDTANYVLDTLAFAYDDGTTIPTGATAVSGDSCACGPVISDVNGKIAVLYRGACQFGTKALNAQNQGAVAVIIINNNGDAVGMQGGDDGVNVTIPVVMIGEDDGAIISAAMETDSVVVFIGNKLGYFDYDLGFQNSHVLRAEQFSNPAPISQDASQFAVELGAWVYNYGVNAQTDVILNANINLGGASVYSNGSAPISIAANDSAYISLPTFSQTTYSNGYYSLTYTLVSAATDEFPNDNLVSADFVIDEEMYSYCALDSALLPVINGGSRFGTGQFTSCISFKNGNTSSVGLFAKGMSFGAVTNADADLIGKYFSLTLYQWDDVFTDINDAAFANLTGVAFGEYVYINDDQAIPVYADLFPQIPLNDNQWYLGCVTATDAEVFIGYDNAIDYKLNSTTYKTPMFPVGEAIPTQPAFGGGSGEGGLTTQAPSIVMHMATGVGIDESEIVDITPFPNPTSDYISIPFGKLEGNATITISDMSGKTVKTVSVSMLSNDVTKINVSNLPSGMYVFHTELENGGVANFNVVINK